MSKKWWKCKHFSSPLGVPTCNLFDDLCKKSECTGSVLKLNRNGDDRYFETDDGEIIGPFHKYQIGELNRLVKLFNKKETIINNLKRENAWLYSDRNKLTMISMIIEKTKDNNIIVDKIKEVLEYGDG